MSSNPSFSYGLIAGGMNDGYIHVWDPAKLASGEPDDLIASVEQHQGTYVPTALKGTKEGSSVHCEGNDGDGGYLGYW